MSTSLPPVPKKDSAGRRLALVAAVVAAVLAGVVAWNVLSRPAAEPAPAPPKPVAVVRPSPAVEPPPPPPEEEPAVQAPPEPPKPEPSKRAAPRRDASCEGACTGRETPELLSALRARAGQARSCYERALAQNSSLSGSILLNVRVSPSGTTCSASMGKDTLGDAAVASCVLQRFRSGKFPKPSAGCVDVALPINFVPQR